MGKQWEAADVPTTSGIYLLKHRKTKDTYIGSAKIMRLRFCGHLSELRRGTHPNRRMQGLANDHGVNFSCKVLEETGDDPRFAAERRWIEKLRPTLNLCTPPKTGGRVRTLIEQD